MTRRFSGRSWPVLGLGVWDFETGSRTGQCCYRVWQIGEWDLNPAPRPPFLKPMTLTTGKQLILLQLVIPPVRCTGVKNHKLVNIINKRSYKFETCWFWMKGNNNCFKISSYKKSLKWQLENYVSSKRNIFLFVLDSKIGRK